MANQYRRGGSIELIIDGQRYDAKGAFTYGIGNPMREAVIGVDGVHGFKETHQTAFIEGTVTDSPNLDLKRMTLIEDVTVLVKLANGKSFVLSNAWFAGEGTGDTDEGEISLRFEGMKGEELR